MTNASKRVLSLLVVAVMVISMIPATVFATDAQTDEPVDAPKYVAMIGTTGYESLQAAIEAVQNGETIVLQSNVTITTPAHGTNALNHARAVNFTLDLGGYEIYADSGNSVLRFNITGSGATSNVTITVQNGKIVSGPNTWCAVMAAGISANAKAVMNLKDLVIENSKPGDYAVKAWDNSIINADNVTVNSTNAAGGFYAVGGEMVLDNCTANQRGLHTLPYMSAAFGVSNNGKMTINSGTYSSEPTAAAEGNNQGSSHGSWVGNVMSSGGTLIINGGTFSNGNFGDDALATAPRALLCIDAYGRLEINGGQFNALASTVFMINNTSSGVAGNPTAVIKGGNFVAGDPTNSGKKALFSGYPEGLLTVSGGTFNAPVAENLCAAGYEPKENGDGTYGVEVDPAYGKVAMVGDTYYDTLQDAVTALQANGGTLTLLADATINTSIVILKNTVINGNGHKLTVNGAYGIDVKAGVELEINDLTLESNSYAINFRGASDNAKAEINNSYIKGYGALNIWGSDVIVDVNNSTLHGHNHVSGAANGFSVIILNARYSLGEVSNGTKVNVNGGKIVATRDDGCEFMAIGRVDSITGEINISSETVIENNAGGEVQIQYSAASHGAAISATLQDAIDNAAPGETVILLRDIELTEPVVIPVGKTVVLDLNGKTLTGAATSSDRHIYTIHNYGTLTIKGNGTITGRGIYNGYDGENVYATAVMTIEEGVNIYAVDTNGGFAVGNYATLTINGGTIKAREDDPSDPAVSGNYDATALYNVGNATINGGTIISTTNFTYAVTTSGTLTVNGGYIKGRGGIAVNAGTATINGGTICNDIDNASTGHAVYVGSGKVIITNGAFTATNDVNDGNTTVYVENGAVAEISGGTFTTNNYTKAPYGKENGTITISGGTFDKAIAEKYCAEGFQPVDNGDGTYGVKVEEKPSTIVDVNGVNFRLQSLLKLTFYFAVETEEEILDVGAIVWTADEYAAETDLTINHTTGKLYTAKPNGNGYEIETDGVYAQNIDTVFYIVPFVKTASGYTYGYNDAGEAKSNSILNVANILYATGNDNVKSIIRDLLNYATAARAYFCITENLPTPAVAFNSSLSVEDQVIAWDENVRANKAAVDEETGEYAPTTHGISSNLLESIKLNFIFNDSTVAGMYYWNEEDYRAAAVHDGTTRTGDVAFERQGNYATGSILNIYAYDLYDNFYVRAYNAEGQLTKTYTSSMAAYLTTYMDYYGQNTDEESVAFVALCKALLVYGNNAMNNPAISKN